MPESRTDSSTRCESSALTAPRSTSGQGLAPMPIFLGVTDRIYLQNRHVVCEPEFEARLGDFHGHARAFANRHPSLDPRSQGRGPGPSSGFVLSALVVDRDDLHLISWEHAGSEHSTGDVMATAEPQTARWRSPKRAGCATTESWGGGWSRARSSAPRRRSSPRNSAPLLPVPSRKPAG